MPRAVILTALPVEYLAVRNRLLELQEKEHPQGTVYEQGKFVGKGQEWEVGIAEVGAGNAGAAVEAERAIAYFQPNILLFVGIAGGIKDVAIGDVVVATDVFGYESGKVTEQFFPRPKAGKSAYRLVERAKSEARKGEWLQRLDSIPVPQPRVFVVPIVAGEKVVASRKSDIFPLLRGSYNDVIAVEMEGFGFLRAAFAHPSIPAIVIRGISDLIEGKNDDSVESEDIRQEKASHHASAFAFEMLSKLVQEGRRQNPPLTPPRRGTGDRREENLFSKLLHPFELVGYCHRAALEKTSPQQLIFPSCAITAVGGFKLIQGELELLTVILLAVGLVSLLSICLYVFFKQSQTNISGDRVSSVKHYRQQTRRLALLGLFAVALLMVLSSAGWYRWHNLQKHQVVVLVADFKNLQSENRGVTEDILNQLKEALGKYQDVKVQALHETITSQEGSEVARAKGKKHHADIVLWGWYGESKQKVKVTVKFEVLEKLRYLSSVETNQLTQSIAKLESFEIQTQLSKETTYLTLFTIGLVRYEAEDYDGAIARLTKALEFVPDAEQTIVQEDTAIDVLYFYRGGAYYSKEELDKAIADYNQALKINPKDVEVYINRGNAYYQKGELDKAIADYNLALKINPEFAKAYYNRGIAYYQKGELDKAIADYTQAIKFHPKDAEAYYNRGIAYYQKGELDKAIADYTQAIKFHPKDAKAYYNRGIAYYQKGELDKAIADYTQALKIYPKFAPAYNNRGFAYSDKGEFDKAIADFNLALKIHPELAKVYNNRGNAYSDKGELDQAIADYTQALTINPKDVEAYNNRGIAYSDKGELDKAIADYTQALKIYPKFAPAYNNRGFAYSDKGELDKAIADYNLALKIHPELAKVYNNRGNAYSDKGELDQAIADYTQALTINPKDVEAYNNRGIAYSDKGELDKAIAD
ncbi:MAG: tetratricopeptide repeat protein, partial [Symploca sp. SIO2E6]|nr:tetratricopeptide repeat protein [Symploca sp. SIO2E6]